MYDKCIVYDGSLDRKRQGVTTKETMSNGKCVVYGTQLFFKCPVCLEKKLIDVILPCKHCLCRECHEALKENNGGRVGYKCPYCITIADCPILHFLAV